MAKQLSPREADCLALAAQGLRTREIADRLGISPVVARDHLFRGRRKQRASRLAPLSPRQEQMLRLLATGMGYADAGEAMGISMMTARNHASEAYDRLGVDNAIEAFVALGWLNPPPFRAE